eukprot:11195814-Lingulodinium_polyedra.AAC.1
MASFQWVLEIGDIKSAFMEAKPFDRPAGKLYAEQPPGGIPGVENGRLMDILIPMYGLADAAARWFEEISEECTKA